MPAAARSLPRSDHDPPVGCDERRRVLRRRRGERALVQAAQDGEAGARDELVDLFMPLIGSVARLYRGMTAVHRAELMQAGVVGLLTALERFDPRAARPSGRTPRGGCARRCSRSSPSWRDRS